ncbi:MAG: ABC transporter permease subunit [bacterium]
MADIGKILMRGIAALVIVWTSMFILVYMGIKVAPKVYMGIKVAPDSGQQVHITIPGIIKETSVVWSEIIKETSVVWSCFWKVTIRLMLIAFLISLILSLVSLTQVYILSSAFKIFLSLFSCLPVFIAGILLWKFFCYNKVPPQVEFITAGVILGICDTFLIELYRHIEIEYHRLKNESYVLMAKDNGLKVRKIIPYLMNDIIILLSKITFSRLIGLISGAVIVECIFRSISGGIGCMLMDAVKNNSSTKLIGIEIGIVTIVITFNVIDRLIERHFNPRLKEG